MATSTVSGTLWVLITLSVVAAAAIAGGVWTARRLASSQRSERETRRRFELLSATSRDYASWVLSPNGRIVEWTDGAERLHGYGAEEMVGRHSSVLYSAADRAANVPQRVLELAARQGSHTFQGGRIHKQGRELRIESTLHALRAASGQLTGFYEIEHDVSERLQREQTLQQTRAALVQSLRLEAIGRLSGGVAHDFNNVVQVIKNCVRVLQRRLADQSQLLQFIDMIERNADRAAELSQQLLGFARLESLEPGVTNVHEVVLDAVQMLRRTLSEGITLQHTLGGARPWTSMDRTQLEATLLNLAANARDVMPAGGILSIETANPALEPAQAEPDGSTQYVTICVSDSGPGPTPHTEPRPRPGFAERLARGEQPGSLALQQIRSIIEQMGGRVTIDQRPGGGSAVTLWLPCSPAPAGPSGAWRERPSAAVDSEPTPMARASIILD